MPSWVHTSPNQLFLTFKDQVSTYYQMSKTFLPYIFCIWLLREGSVCMDPVWHTCDLQIVTYNLKHDLVNSLISLYAFLRFYFCYSLKIMCICAYLGLGFWTYKIQLSWRTEEVVGFCRVTGNLNHQMWALQTKFGSFNWIVYGLHSWGISLQP